MKSEKILFLKNSYLLVAAFLLFLFPGCAQNEVQLLPHAESYSCITQGWPHDGSDLKPDPNLMFDSLENGLRYVIMHNEEPKDRVGLYLNIQAGSLAERDSQLGYAHFLEHMLFNGTIHYPAGTLVEYFQSIGMAFGSDTNAHTTFDETVYRILLPDGSRKNLHDGLLVMADYARGALLLEEEVERERGIILAEKRTRDSVSYRLWEKRTQFSFAGTRVAERFPIGTDETLEKADAESLRSYYDTWYRPENMILVVVGDVDKDLARKMIAERFSSLSAPAIQPDCFDFGRVEEKGYSFLYVHEPELGATELTIGTNWNTLPKKDTVARQKDEIIKYIATYLLRNRLRQLVSEPGSPLTKAAAYSGDFQQRVGYASVTATVEGENWRQGLELLNTTIRQAQEQGFSARELKRVKKEILSDLGKEIQTASSRDSRNLASNIIDALNRNIVFLSPEQELQLYGPVVESLTLAEANATFRTNWDHENRKVIVAGTAEIAGDTVPEDTVRKAFEMAQSKKLDPWHENNVVAFPYLSVPEDKGRIVNQEHFEAIDVSRYTFANGTILNIKKTPFEPNQVFVEVHFGYGKNSETIPGLSMLSQSVVNESGTGKLTKVELEDALAGHTVKASFSIGNESFSIKGNALTNELELLFQLISAHLLDPGFRKDAYDLSMERFAQNYEKMSTSVEGLMRLRGESFLAGGNPHYGIPCAEQFSELTLEQVQEWLVPVFSGAPLEVSVAGDIELDDVVALVGRYLGTIERHLTETPVEKAVVFPSGELLEESVVTQLDKALVTVAWPTDDFWDISRTRRLNTLSSVLSERIRVEIRERLGAVYSPSVYNQSSRTASGYGVLRAMLTVDPVQSGEVVARVREVGELLAREGVSSDELKRSLEPTLTSIKDMKKTNRYWLQSVMTLSSRHPEQLAWPLTIQDDFASITAQEISDFAARYLKPEATAEIIFMPIVQ